MMETFGNNPTKLERILKSIQGEITVTEKQIAAVRKGNLNFRDI